MSVRWYPEDLWQHTAPVLPGFTVEVLPRIDSTNTELMRRARAGQTEPILLIAEDQTAGKGRQGRPWSNAPGSSLMCSLALPWPRAIGRACRWPWAWPWPRPCSQPTPTPPCASA